MPWLETSPVEQREQFIRDHRVALYTMSELCARYDVSRKTGYKWLARFDEAGRRGLQDRSRAPHQCPHRIADEVAAVICAARRQHPSWGPAKLLPWLRPRYPALDLPAISTAGDLLARRGLVNKRRRRRHYQHPGVVPPTTTQPNDLWTADFKGHFRTRDGIYCYPLTIADQHTRYLLACHGLLSTKGHGVRPVFDRLFREYGLPSAIRTDNGVPFEWFARFLHPITHAREAEGRTGFICGGRAPSVPLDKPLSRPPTSPERNLADPPAASSLLRCATTPEARQVLRVRFLGLRDRSHHDSLEPLVNVGPDRPHVPSVKAHRGQRGPASRTSRVLQHRGQRQSAGGLHAQGERAA